VCSADFLASDHFPLTDGVRDWFELLGVRSSRGGLSRSSELLLVVVKDELTT
jgi:hypothetical protein